MVMVMAIPGNITSHQGGRNSSLSTPPNIFPHVGVGGGTPMPKKLKAASVNMAAPSPALATTALWCNVTSHDPQS